MNNTPELKLPSFYYNTKQYKELQKMNNEEYVKIKKNGEWVSSEIFKDEEPYPTVEIPGIHYRKESNKYTVRLVVDGVRKRYGSYKTLEEAIKVWNTVIQYRDLLDKLQA